MKAQTFKIIGSVNLLKAIGEELIDLGYSIDYHTKSPSYIVSPISSVGNDTTISRFKELYGGISGVGDKIFELPQQYDKALAFAKEQLEDKYWIKTPQKWDVGTFMVLTTQTSTWYNKTIGFVDEIQENRGSYLMLKEYKSLNKFNPEDAFQWFATRKEAEEFAETLKPKPIKVTTPKFKVGDYITNNNNPIHIARITSINDDTYNYWGYDGAAIWYDNGKLWLNQYLRLATPKEIEEFLIKIAKIKGLIVGTKFQGVTYMGDVAKNVQEDITGNYTYDKSSDTLSNDPIKGYFYAKGNWATIIPESKPVVKEFILPDKWCIQVTPENQEIISIWRTCGSCHTGGYCLSKGHPDAENPNVDGYYLSNKPKNTVEITSKQFEKYVIGKTTSTVTKLPFGNLEFTIHKGVTNYASCKEGNITPDEIQAIVDWFDKDFKLLGHSMQIVNEGKWFIKFGCCKGTLAEAKAILKAFN